VREYVGGYEDWVRQRDDAAPVAERKKKSGKARPREAAPRPRKRTYAEQLELDALPGRIEELEAQRDAVQARIADPAFFKGGKDQVTGTLAQLEAMEAEVAAVYERWEELEALPG
jgi:ABC transport system ATP-binding/permease protein